jgi:predicted sugar kinase
MVVDTSAAVVDSETTTIKFYSHIRPIGLFWHRIRAVLKDVIRYCVHPKLSSTGQAVYTVVDKIKDTIQQRDVTGEHLDEEPLLWVRIG